MFRRIRRGSGPGVDRVDSEPPLAYSVANEQHDSANNISGVLSFRSTSEPGAAQGRISRSLGDTLSRAGTTASSRSPSRDRDTRDPLGLNLIHGDPQYEADVIFVHGLGGSSRRTWTWERNVDIFWPAWIRHEEGLSHCRVFSFGYNSNIAESGTQFSILEFSKGLLYRMKTFGEGNTDSHGVIGLKPIVFVAHSMGGLVVKKALIIGKHDAMFSAMLSKVHGILFLATPHQGSSHAHTINNILSVMFSKKVYISELDGSSTSIEDINEQFRAICSAWQLVSLYETLPTKVTKGIKRMIVDKNSGVLNYPKEMSMPVDADHHSICKYESRLDANYKLTTGLLRQLTQHFRPKGPAMHRELDSPDADDTKDLREILGIRGDPRADLDSILSRAMPDSCKWLHRHRKFKKWLESPEPSDKLLWLTGLPGSGKSTLAAKTVDHIQKALLESSCQFYFFLETQHAKRSAALCLRSIAFQLATAYPDFALRLRQLHTETGFTASAESFTAIWASIFENIAFKMDFGCTLHWVIDGLDEADTPTLLARHFAKMNSQSCIKLLFLSRPKKDLITLVTSHLGPSAIASISTDQTLADIRDFISTIASEFLPADQPISKTLVKRIATEAEGSFLWTRLTLDSLRDNWHTQADIESALNNVPRDMKSIYQRMLDSVRAQSSRLQEIAFRVLVWASYGFQCLTIKQLEAILDPEFGPFSSLGETVVQICGQFIRLEKDYITPIHSTARKFLLDPSSGICDTLGFPTGHDHLAMVCIQYLSQDHWRQTLSEVSEVRTSSSTDRLESLYHRYPLLKYSMENWAYHVGHASAASSSLISVLRLFCRKYILQWIQAIALSGVLKNVPKAAQHLKKWLRKRKRRVESHRPEETNFLTEWSKDLIRITGKFGSNLVESPSTIHRHIPPLCPHGSVIGQTYGRQENALVSVKGCSITDWDDNLARVSLGQDEIASKIRCAGIYFLTLISHSGTVIVWRIETCEELRRLEHEEWVLLMEINKPGSLAVTSGRFTIRIWEISTGKQLYSIPKLKDARVMSLNFAKADTELIVGYDDCSVVSYALTNLNSTPTALFADQDQHTHQNCPKFMSLSPDLSNVAIAFRGRPVTITSMIPQPKIGPRVCIREADRDLPQDGDDVFNSPEVVRWHPDGSSVFILYQDTTVLMWDLVEDDQYEFGNTEAREMVLNNEGTCLLTSSNGGSVSVWAVPAFNLIYRLQSEGFVRDLTFSPDGQCIYDVRGSGCNIWAPDALIRADELDREETSSSYDGSFLSEAVSDAIFALDYGSRGRVTALTCDGDGEFFCCGRDDGSVSIHEIQEGARVRKVCNHSTTVDIIALEWATSRRFLASADDSGKIIVKRLRIKEDGKWAVFPVFELRVEEALLQMLFNPDETHLLINTETSDRLWCLQTKKEVYRKRWTENTRRKWINHPDNPNHLVRVDASQLHIHNWSDLALASETTPDPDQSRPRAPSIVLTQPNNAEEVIAGVVLSGSRQYLISETLPGRSLTRSGKGQTRGLDLVQITKLNPASCATAQRKCLKDLSKNVQHLIGCHRERLVFLDHANWVCAVNIGWDTTSVKRHFFLPRDWINSFTLPLLSISKNGALLCALNGEVAIIRYGKGF